MLLLDISEHLLHSLTLALIFDVLEFLLALLDALLLLSPLTVVFERRLALLEVHATLVEPLSLQPLAALPLPGDWILVLDGGGDDGCVGGSKGYKGGEGESEDY
ncbi:hypothetical protein L1987_85122 [Smallanthus sonchifolius]|uniref:Uncharacterized protein n=1 Tax=Smallanthus sonchifolius TaxID=185202 RepID=A0ACB8XWG5_9ASTR|nr:hypothetical protein L1987_85122 [Smallanthus sonchifolius]